jgi:hypothetical protein
VSVQRVLSMLERVGQVFVDPWLVVDKNGQIIEMNRHYHALFPRSVARKLRGSACCQHLKLGTCENECLARRCLRDHGHGAVRYDEIPAVLEGETDARRFIVSAVPLADSDEAEPEAVLILLRDVSDQADVQRKYQDVQTSEAREKEKLRAELLRKTKELMDANQALNRLQQELMSFKKGLLG